MHMKDECWVRLWAGQAVSLMQYQGERVIVYLAGEELELERSVWASLPPYSAPQTLVSMPA
jgi:hypothetical protein